jgi:acyl-CoA oxidase
MKCLLFVLKTLCCSLQAIHRLVEYLSFELRGVAGVLVDGFGIPDALLRAPIGLQSGQYSEYSHHVGFE